MQSSLDALIVRPIQEEDVPALLWSDFEKELEEFHHQLCTDAQQGKLVFLVAILHDEVVGRIRITPYAADGTAWISGLQVKPAKRNTGIGTALMNKAEQLLPLLGQETVYLTVNIHNEKAITLYQRRGFVTISQGMQTWSYPKEGQLIPFSEEVFYMQKLLR